MPQPGQSANEASSLPPGFATGQDILNGKYSPKTRVNFIGIVTDHRVPMATRREDWKCQIRMIDRSLEEPDSVSFNIFRPKHEIPTFSCGDVVVVHCASVQRYQMENPSLLTSYDTRINVYEKAKIPKPPTDAFCALRPASSKKDTIPGTRENAFVSHLIHTIDQSRIPDPSEFEVLQIQSGNAGKKMCELKDVNDGRFCDFVVQIIKDPYDLGDKMTVWVSDYTQNSGFFDHIFGGQGLVADGHDGDPYGYTSKYLPQSSQSEWPGPYGKRCMQITCFEPHATVLRECGIKAGHWISMSNVQVKYGHNGCNLEGFLRGDEGFGEGKVRITRLDLHGDPEDIHPSLKAALRRKRDYERDKKDQIKSIKAAAEAGQKRKADTALESDKADDNQKENAKARRARRRAAQAHLQKTGSNKETEGTPTEPDVEVDVNPNVKCENESKRFSSLEDLTEPIVQELDIEGDKVNLQLPFVNAVYRTNVRVVDFMPSNLEDFARPKKLSESEFANLSDYEPSESGSNSGSESESERVTKAKEWEWRFYLQFEDAAVPPNKEKSRVWVAVDNQAAQCLMSLDATNLRADPERLEEARQKLWVLWGELEEHKKREAELRAQSIRDGKPPADSDDDEDTTDAEAPVKKPRVANLPFSCCVRQYGVKVRERDPAKADAGDVHRWQRMYGLFGTRISGV